MLYNQGSVKQPVVVAVHYHGCTVRRDDFREYSDLSNSSNQDENQDN